MRISQSPKCEPRFRDQGGRGNRRSVTVLTHEGAPRVQDPWTASNSFRAAPSLRQPSSISASSTVAMDRRRCRSGGGCAKNRLPGAALTPCLASRACSSSSPPACPKKDIQIVDDPIRPDDVPQGRHRPKLPSPHRHAASQAAGRFITVIGPAVPGDKPITVSSARRFRLLAGLGWSAAKRSPVPWSVPRA